MLMYTPKKKNKFIDNLVSIIMPAFNSAGYICESIDSVLAQTYAEWELWVVDDGSMDNTADIVKNFKDKRIHYVKQSTNKGVSAARNLGIERSRGRFLAFLDSDDVWLPEKLEKQLDFMHRKKCGISYTEYRHFGNQPDVAGKLIRTRDSVDYQGLLRGNDIGCLTVIIDRWQHPRIVMPPYRHEDYLTWLGLLSGGGMAYSLHEDLARYRKSDKSLSSNKWNNTANVQITDFIDDFFTIQNRLNAIGFNRYLCAFSKFLINKNILILISCI